MASAPSAHRPRKRRKGNASSQHNSPSENTVVRDSDIENDAPAFPLVAFLWPAKRATSQWIVLPSILMVVGLFRWAMGLWGYSGFQSPPMHGDFEAQRHWMEITAHLPISSWYFYDLQYWGLDYPPLTAYHSWVLEKIGSCINPSWFALETSRGIEEPLLKVFMRATVIVSEYVTYIPAAVIFVRRFSRSEGVDSWEASIALVAILMQPATMLIDHAHFQYNTVMLGLVLAMLSSFQSKSFLWGSFFFVMALGFKQMALYYAPAVFAYLLGSCIFPKVNILRFVSIAMITASSFAVLYAPIVIGSLNDRQQSFPRDAETPPLLKAFPVSFHEEAWYYPPILQLAQSIHRIFPFARGLFEDKVANSWCVIHTFYKLNRFSIPTLQRFSLLATVVAIGPPCLIIFLYPKKRLLPYALTATAWGFFLFSFQVHEKSDLLPLLPMTLLLAGNKGLSSESRAWVGFANLLGVWTLFPLLKRDQLRVPYFAISGLWAYLLGLPCISPGKSENNKSSSGDVGLLVASLHGLFYFAMISWHVTEAFIEPPISKPDLWVVLNCIIGASGFSVCYMWSLWKLISESSSRQSSDADAKKAI